MAVYNLKYNNTNVSTVYYNNEVVHKVYYNNTLVYDDGIIFRTVEISTFGSCSANPSGNVTVQYGSTLKISFTSTNGNRVSYVLRGSGYTHNDSEDIYNSDHTQVIITLKNITGTDIKVMGSVLNI